MVPGIAPSADPVFHTRMFAYPDAAQYRLGVNYQQLPCNHPICPIYSLYQHNVFINSTTNYSGDPNYVRSSLKPIWFQGSVSASSNAISSHNEWVTGAVRGYTSELTDDDFMQPRAFWNMLGKQPGQQEHLASNAANHLSSALPSLHQDALDMSSSQNSHTLKTNIFARVDPTLAQMIKQRLSRM
ncbi:catalase [Ilyonectria sp. MPI-CAGE-AT-0026]|nr:catalase [Ilyonectria sp. MPI-CAGE-AT-0026]